MLAVRLFAFLALSVLAGCYSTSIAQTPSTVAPGKVRGGVGMSVNGSTTGSAGLSPELSMRVGVLDRVDLGLKTNLQSFEGQVKGQIVRGDFDLSLAVSAALSRDQDASLFDESGAKYDWTRSGRLMLIAGQRVFDSIDLVVMGDGQYGVRSGESGNAWSERFVGVGGGLGVLFKGPAQFLPEIVVTQFVEGQNPAHPAVQAGDTRVQFTVTALLGAEDDHDPH
jgi:hypothetical protein